MLLPRHWIAIVGVLLLAETSSADNIYRCQLGDQQVFQDHPCDQPRQSVTADPIADDGQTQRAARQDCQHWSDIGYLAAVARDRKEPQQAVQDRFAEDGLEDGEREAINWAYREFHSKPDQIKDSIREDCLREQLKEVRKPLFGGRTTTYPGEFAIGDKHYVMSVMPPWRLDNTQSGSKQAGIYLTATGNDPGKITVVCQMANGRLTEPAAEEQLLRQALDGTQQLASLPVPIVQKQRYSNGLFGYVVLPLPTPTGSPDFVLKQPRYVVHGLYDKDDLRCTSRIETLLPSGPAQRTGIQAISTIFPKTNPP